MNIYELVKRYLNRSIGATVERNDRESAERDRALLVLLDMPTRVRKYEPSLRYRRWQLVDKFTMRTSIWLMLLGLPLKSKVHYILTTRMIDIERECSELCTTYEDFEQTVGARIRIEFGVSP